MKKILAFLVALGLIITGGKGLSVMADSPNDYADYPTSLLPPQH